MATENKKYKDRLFNFIFGAEENKEWTLSLYNAVNGSSYTDPTDIEFTTIKDIIYLGMRNDVSFLISNEMNLYEQQSSFNPNMPVRMLQYAGNLYEQYISRNNLNKYSSTLLELPVPKLVVFYNGRAEQGDETYLRLSDSFAENAQSDIEVTVKMLNVNFGHNKKLLEDCRTLFEYSWLVEEIRENKLDGDIDNAIDKAITDMPDDFILKKFLLAHRAEVKGMLLTEYDEVEAMEKFREDGRKEGQKTGQTNVLRLIAALDKDGKITDIKRLIDDPDSLEELYKKYGIE